jgi:hypothetical protein
VAAHKVVLSASSSFFRQFLRDTGQAHPWIFLRGVQVGLLEQLLDFIYLGEVMVTQEAFPAFLALARDLGVRGLTGAASLPTTTQTGYTTQTSYTDVMADGTVEWSADVVKTETEQEEEEAVVAPNIPDFDMLEDSRDSYSEPALVIAEDSRDSYRERALVIAEDEDINSLSKEERVKLRVEQRLLNSQRRLMPPQLEVDSAEQSVINAELDQRIGEMIVRRDGAWVCNVCGKMANHKSKLKQHAETHLQGYSHPCSLCGKTYRSRY